MPNWADTIGNYDSTKLERRVSKLDFFWVPNWKFIWQYSSKLEHELIQAGLKMPSRNFCN